MAEVKIREASIDDAKALTDLAYTTFWDAFAHHPKNAPDDLNHYMRQAFSLEQTTKELGDENSVFLIAELDGEPAGYGISDHLCIHRLSRYTYLSANLFNAQKEVCRTDAYQIVRKR